MKLTFWSTKNIKLVYEFSTLKILLNQLFSKNISDFFIDIYSSNINSYSLHYVLNKCDNTCNVY